MNLRQAVRIWRAWWILTSVLLILAMVGAAGAVAKMPRYYQSASSVVLLASRSASMQNDGNPFLSFSPSLYLTADAVSRELMAPGTVGQLAAHGFTASYTVALPSYTTSTTGSVLLVTVTGSDAAGVQRTNQAVTAEIGAELAQLQRGVPARGQVRAVTLSSTPQAALSISQTARPLVVVGALLLVICLGTPIVVDGLVARRRLRNRPALPDYPALPQDWALVDDPAFPHRSAFQEEPAFPGGAKGSADQQTGDDPAQGELLRPWSSLPPTRNGGPSRQVSGADGWASGPRGRQPVHNPRPQW
jgi:hypothetical protein